MNFNKKEIFTIPNILTYIRILCVPFFIWIIIDESIPYNIYIAFGIFIFATLTDLVDGFIARHFKLISDIGKVADPIADKLLQVSTLVCLTVLGKIHWAFPMIFCIKETYMVLGGSVIVKIFKSEYIIQSNIFGKLATCLNSLGILLAFFVGEFDNLAYDIAAFVILGCGAIFAVVTATIYTIQFFQFRKKELQAKRLKNEQTDCCESSENAENATEEKATAENDNITSIESVIEDNADSSNAENEVVTEEEIVTDSDLTMEGNNDLATESKVEIDND